jgi:hypothetical protein
MPKLTELPANAALTGAEIIVVVQNGETRQVALSAALIARHPVNLNNTRWIKTNHSTALINNPAVILDLSSASSGGG